jgi:hypothetical protein
MSKMLAADTTPNPNSDDDRPPKDVLDRLLDVLLSLASWFMQRLFKKWF